MGEGGSVCKCVYVSLMLERQRQKEFLVCKSNPCAVLLYIINIFVLDPQKLCIATFSTVSSVCYVNC